MPNHVYNSISVEEKYADRLRDIAEVGLCRYYFPMPEELKGTNSPPRIGVGKNDNITQEKYDYLKEKYGHADWYGWCIANWGTKWGCYDNEVDDGVYTFTTAWSPVDDKIIQKLMEDIPSFQYSFEEEQGWGAEITIQDGVIKHSFEYDTPIWDSVPKAEELGLEIFELVEDYENTEGKFKKGYYAWCSLQEFLSDDLNDAIEIYRDDNNI